MVPSPRFADIDELNAHLLERCLARQTSVLRGAEGASIADRLATDQTALAIRRLPKAGRPREQPSAGELDTRINLAN